MRQDMRRPRGRQGLVRLRRRARRRVPYAPWTAEEDAVLAEMVRVGVSSDFWTSLLPGRTFGEMAARRLDLGLPRARQI